MCSIKASTHNHPSAERRLRLSPHWFSQSSCFSQPSFSRKAVATAVRLRLGVPIRLTTILQPKGGCDAGTAPPGESMWTHNHPSAERRLRRVVNNVSTGGHLTTILQPKGGCDSTLVGQGPSDEPHNHPSAERRLRQKKTGGRETKPTHNHPSAERRLRHWTRAPQSRGTPLTTILQPKGGCDLCPSATIFATASHNHPSAERRLRLRHRGGGATGEHSQPSFSRKAVATCASGSLIPRRCSQPSFSRKAVATP